MEKISAFHKISPNPQFRSDLPPIDIEILSLLLIFMLKLIFLGLYALIGTSINVTEILIYIKFQQGVLILGAVTNPQFYRFPMDLSTVTKRALKVPVKEIFCRKCQLERILATILPMDYQAKHAKYYTC